jgi:hypothetical protein
MYYHLTRRRFLLSMAGLALAIAILPAAEGCEARYSQEKQPTIVPAGKPPRPARIGVVHLGHQLEAPVVVGLACRPPNCSA